jgi:FkbM family methyltransferase
MNYLWRVLRAEYHWQPTQLPRRAWRILTGVRRRNRAVIRLPWGLPITVNPRESIGRSIVALNVLDLPVTETIWRLLDDGEVGADVGANIGYMTSVMAARLRRGGAIHSFEPIVEVADFFQANVAAWSGLSRVTIHLHRQAVTDHSGTATMQIPVTFSENSGQASLAPPAAWAGAAPAQSVVVPCCRLDEIMGDAAPWGVMKVDVEGFEAEVFRGAGHLLTAGKVRDIVFEEHRPFEAESLQLLGSCQYRVYRVVRGWTGPRLRPPDWHSPRELDPPTYLATRDAARAQARFAPRGWACLRAGSQPPGGSP